MFIETLLKADEMLIKTAEVIGLDSWSGQTPSNVLRALLALPRELLLLLRRYVRLVTIAVDRYAPPGLTETFRLGLHLRVRQITE